MDELEALERELPERQKIFVRALVENGGDVKEAAIAAGYSEKTAAAQGNRLLKEDKVCAYRRALSRQIYENLGLSAERIGLELFQVYQRCMAAKPHMEWDREKRAWVPDGTWCFDVRGATRALELLGKMLGAFSDKGESAAPQSLEAYLEALEGKRSF